MYKKPLLERFGTFRELTLVGFEGVTDGCTIIGPDSTSDTGSEFDSTCDLRS